MQRQAGRSHPSVRESTPTVAPPEAEHGCVRCNLVRDGMGARKSQDPSRRTKDGCAPLMVCIGRRVVRQWKPLDPGAFVQDGSRRREVRSGPSMEVIGRLRDRQWKPLDPSVGALVLVYEKRLRPRLLCLSILHRCRLFEDSTQRPFRFQATSARLHIFVVDIFTFLPFCVNKAFVRCDS